MLGYTSNTIKWFYFVYVCYNTNLKNKHFSGGREGITETWKRLIQTKISTVYKPTFLLIKRAPTFRHNFQGQLCQALSNPTYMHVNLACLQFKIIDLKCKQIHRKV